MDHEHTDTGKITPRAVSEHGFANSSEEPPLKPVRPLGILELILCTTTIALAIVWDDLLVRYQLSFQQGTDTWTAFYRIASATTLGLFMAGLIILVRQWKEVSRPGTFPRNPGHWFIIFEGLSGFTLIVLTTFFGALAYQWGELTEISETISFRVLPPAFQVVQYSLIGLINLAFSAFAIVAAFQIRRCGWHWVSTMMFFALKMVTAAIFYSMFVVQNWFQTNFSMINIFFLLEPISTTVTALVLLTAITISLVRKEKLDWIHGLA